MERARHPSRYEARGRGQVLKTPTKRAYPRRKPAAAAKTAAKKKVEYCLPCGIKGTPEPAVTKVEGDPMCSACAHEAKTRAATERARIVATLGNSAAIAVEDGAVELELEEGAR